MTSKALFYDNTKRQRSVTAQSKETPWLIPQKLSCLFHNISLGHADVMWYKKNLWCRSTSCSSVNEGLVSVNYGRCRSQRRGGRGSGCTREGLLPTWKEGKWFISNYWPQVQQRIFNYQWRFIRERWNLQEQLTYKKYYTYFIQWRRRCWKHSSMRERTAKLPPDTDLPAPDTVRGSEKNTGSLHWEITGLVCLGFNDNNYTDAYGLAVSACRREKKLYLH